MKIIECVKDIYLGLNKKETRHTANDNIIPYDLLTIRSVNNKFINNDLLDKYESLTKIDEKFLSKKGDIIICSKPPYNVVLVDENCENILIPNNFIILRNIDINNVYLYNYLNLLGPDMKFNKKDENNNITKSDIEQLNINYDESVVNKIADLSSKINKRQEAYGKLLDNDQELIRIVYIKGGVIKDYE